MSHAVNSAGTSELQSIVFGQTFQESNREALSCHKQDHAKKKIQEVASILGSKYWISTMSLRSSAAAAYAPQLIE
jgi:hypothetical protein